MICEKELRHLLGDRCDLTCTKESAPGYDHRRIDADYLWAEIDDAQQYFCVCGPPDMVDNVQAALKGLGVVPDRSVLEE